MNLNQIESKSETQNIRIFYGKIGKNERRHTLKELIHTYLHTNENEK